MSNYPIWWDSTITVYNRYENPVTNLVTWTKTVIKNCFTKRANNQVTVGNAVLETDEDIIRIKKDKRYKRYDEWINIPNDEKSKYFTLHTDDIIVFKEVNDDINEYVSGERSTDFMSKYKALDLCIQITQVQDNTGNGRGLPHYFVSGKA